MATKLLSVTATEILPGNTSRISMVILNEDATDIVYVKREQGEALTVSATDHDFRIAPGASLSLSNLIDGSANIQSRYTAIASANTPRVSFFETENIRR